MAIGPQSEAYACLLGNDVTLSPLQLDYQSNVRWRQWPGWVLLCLGILLSLLLIAHYRHLEMQRDQAEHTLTVLKRKQALHSMTLARDEARDTQASGKPAPRWNSLFTVLEAAADDSVTLLGLDPTSKGIILSGEAKDLDSALTYVRRLKASGQLGQLRMTDQETLKDHPRRPLRFSLEAEWSGAPA